MELRFHDQELIHRAIAGLSMGGAQPVATTNNNPSLFDYIGVFSAGGQVGDSTVEAQLSEIKKDGVKLYWTDAAIGIFRTRGKVHAYYNRWPHQSDPVSQGKIPGPALSSASRRGRVPAGREPA